MQFRKFTTRWLAALAGAGVLGPSTAAASPIVANPKIVALQIGARDSARVAATTGGLHLVISPATTCFSTKGGPDDILRVTAMNESRGSERSLSIDVRAQHPGTCDIVFASDKDNSVIKVVVKP